jgi:hypothetical protein
VDLGERLSDDGVERVPAELLGDPVHEQHAAVGVGGDHSVADAAESHGQAVLLGGEAPLCAPTVLDVSLELAVDIYELSRPHPHSLLEFPGEVSQRRLDPHSLVDLVRQLPRALIDSLPQLLLAAPEPPHP